MHLPTTSDPTKPAEDTIEDLALALLGSASLNSARHADALNQSVPAIHARYRQVVTGNCLVLTYDTPVTIETMGGAVSAYEIVIGLGRPDYADAVFTIDGSGRVVVHEKYSAGIAIELRRAADAAVGAH